MASTATEIHLIDCTVMGGDSARAPWIGLRGALVAGRGESFRDRETIGSKMVRCWLLFSRGYKSLGKGDVVVLMVKKGRI